MEEFTESLYKEIIKENSKPFNFVRDLVMFKYDLIMTDGIISFTLRKGQS